MLQHRLSIAADIHLCDASCFSEEVPKLGQPQSVTTDSSPRKCPGNMVLLHVMARVFLED